MKIPRPPKLIALLFFLFCTLFVSHATAQYRYSKEDLAQISKQRKIPQHPAFRGTRKQYLQLGRFFEKIYDRYKDTSMNAAITYYTHASVTESEYADDSSGYKAASALARIYEKGKGTAVDLNRAIIYYYLSDITPGSGIEKMRNYSKNPHFKRIGPALCNSCKNGIEISNIDSLNISITLSISPFCALYLPETIKKQLAIVLKQHPEIQVAIRADGRSPVMAASYSLFAEQYSIPEKIGQFINSMTETYNIAYDRFLPVAKNYYETNSDYRVVIELVILPDN